MFNLNRGFKPGNSITVKDSIEWMSKTELVETFEINHINNILRVDGNILGLAGGKLITEKVEATRRNVLIVGSAGSGKTSCGLLPQLYQMIKRGESIILTDRITGELYETLKTLLEYENYDIKVVQLNNETPYTSDPQNNHVINHVDISLIAPTEKKCAYFIPIYDYDPVMMACANVFISALQSSLEKHTSGNIPKASAVPVNFILDDISCFGKIDQLPEMLKSLPSRGISYVLTMQSLSQLVRLYPDPEWQAIIASCPIKICFGCGDVETIIILLHYCGINENKPTVDNELIRLRKDNKILILIDDKKPVRIDRFFYKIHPLSEVIGSAHYLSNALNNNVLSSRSLQDLSANTDLILGCDGGNIITKMNDKHNNHVLVIGNSGSGKTSCYVIPHILQCIKRGESLIVTDFNLQIYSTVIEELRTQGYLIKYLKLNDPSDMRGWHIEKDGDDVRDMLIDYAELAQKKCAFFISDTESNVKYRNGCGNYLTNFIEQLNALADSSPDGLCPVPVNIVLDEFPNTGPILRFRCHLRTKRVRGINYMMSCSSLDQIADLYPDGWQQIITSCSTLIVMDLASALSTTLSNNYLGGMLGADKDSVVNHSTPNNKDAFIFLQNSGHFPLQPFHYKQYNFDDLRSQTMINTQAVTDANNGIVPEETPKSPLQNELLELYHCEDMHRMHELIDLILGINPGSPDSDGFWVDSERRFLKGLMLAVRETSSEATYIDRLVELLVYPESTLSFIDSLREDNPGYPDLQLVINQSSPSTLDRIIVYLYFRLTVDVEKGR